MKLSDISRNAPKAPRVVIYGVPGIGKTTLAACAPRPVVIPTEDGLGRIDVPSFPLCTTYVQVIKAIGAIITEPNDYETVILDSLDSLEPMLWQQVCQDNGKQNIEDFGYGKGYQYALAEWRRLLRGIDMLRDKGKIVCLIGHSTVVRFESPEVDAYDRFQLRLHKLAEAAVVDWADVVGFCNYRTTAVQSGERKRGVGDGSRVLLTTERPAWRAKNRYGLPDSIPIPTGNPAAVWDTLLSAVGGNDAAAAAMPVTLNNNTNETN